MEALVQLLHCKQKKRRDPTLSYIHLAIAAILLSVSLYVIILSMKVCSLCGSCGRPAKSKRVIRGKQY